MNKEQLQSSYQNGRRDFSNLDLSGLDLTHINLEGANLTGTNLSGACLNEANLANTNLTRANLSKTRLARANLVGATLNYANLSKTRLYCTNFTNANLTNANLTNIEFEKTNFKGANLQGIQFEGTSFFYANLIDAKNIPSPIFSPSFIPKNHLDIDLVNSLRSLTEGLVCWSDYDYPYDIFLWNRVIRGEFTLEKFLKKIGYLKLTNLQSLQSVEFDTEQPTRDCQILLHHIQKYLSDVEICQFETRDIKEQCPESAIPYIIMGRTIVGDWFGAMIMDELKSEVYTGTSDHFGGDTGISIVTEMNEVLTKHEVAMTKAEHLNLISAVEEAGTKIKYLSWSLAQERDLVLHKLLLAASVFAITGVEELNWVTDEDLRKEEDLDEEEKREQERREAFAQLVRNNLSNIRVYFFGEVCVDVYLIGETPNKDWLGIHTEMLWT